MPEIAPSPGHLLGFVLDSLFTDGLSIDLERLRQVNELLIAGGTTKPGHRPIDVLVIQPSIDPVALARKHVDRMPRSIRMLLRRDRRARSARRSAPELSAVRFELYAGAHAARADRRACSASPKSSRSCARNRRCSRRRTRDQSNTSVPRPSNDAKPTTSVTVVSDDAAGERGIDAHALEHERHRRHRRTPPPAG